MSLALTDRSRANPYAGVLLVAWAAVLLRWGDMGAMPGTMGLTLPAFVGMWTVMMAAMMLPATAPIAGMYARSLPARRLPRMTAFTTGYLTVWALAGLPGYELAVAAGWVADDARPVGTAVAAAIFAANGVYQLSGWKDRCLASCRTPVGMMLRYVSWHGPTRDLRAGAHHGAFCLGCCWTLMALLAAFGMMNLWGMIGLTAAVVLEKAAPYGERLARAFGVASLVLAVGVWWVPAVAPGLTGSATHGAMPM
jgi:predicted metal-binding membrane protein